MDLSKKTDRELEKLLDEIKIERHKRRISACPHDFVKGWNYHNNVEDDYKRCTICGKIEGL